MDLQQVRIYGRSANSHSACNVLLHFECVEFDANDDADSYCVLHRVQLEPCVDSTLLIDVPLDDDDARAHFESLLSTHCHGYNVKTAVAA